LKFIVQLAGKNTPFVEYSDAVQFQKENEKRPKSFLIDDEYAIDEIGAIVFAVTKQSE
jgi:hypothetical protein